MIRVVFLSGFVVAATLFGQASSLGGDGDATPLGRTIATNLPSWRANACLVVVQGVIWNDKIVANQPIKVSLLVKNISKGDVFVPKKFNCNNYLFRTGQTSGAMHGDAAGAISESDYVRLKPAEVTVFSWDLPPSEEPGEGNLCVNFHNNEASEEQVAPKRDGIPIVNDLEYNFGSVKVHASNNIGPANRGQPVGSDTNRTSAAAGPGG